MWKVKVAKPLSQLGKFPANVIDYSMSIYRHNDNQIIAVSHPPKTLVIHQFKRKRK